MQSYGPYTPGKDNVLAIIVIKRAPDGGTDGEVHGRMPVDEFAAYLRAIADLAERVPVEVLGAGIKFEE